jgi:hypothetical protein
MKKTPRKLTLSRETLHNLADRQLQGAAGAATLQNSCDTETFRACPSERCTNVCTQTC